MLAAYAMLRLRSDISSTGGMDARASAPTYFDGDAYLSRLIALRQADARH